MASMLSRIIHTATPLHHVGRLLHFDRSYFGSELDFSGKKLNLRALDFGSNRSLRRVEKRISEQVSQLGLLDLFALAPKKDLEVVIQDHYQLEMNKGAGYAIELLRLFLVEAHLQNELVRVAYDPTEPLPKSLPLLKTQLLNVAKIAKQNARLALKRLRRLFKITITEPAVLLPQRSPNAPNTLLAFSLAAA